MPEAIDPAILQSVADANFKTIAEQPALMANAQMQQFLQLVNAQYQNFLDHRNDLREIGKSNLGRILDNLNNYDPIESRAANQAISGNNTAEIMAALTAAMAQNQQAVKAAQSTPPVS
jgi:hypothetical protein